MDSEDRILGNMFCVAEQPREALGNEMVGNEFTRPSSPMGWAVAAVEMKSERFVMKTNAPKVEVF